MDKNNRKYVCGICGKKSDYEGCVWYTNDMPETNLCRSHYLKWCHQNKVYSDAHSHIKPPSKEFKDMCDEEAKLFMEWFNEQRK